ncbi:hypothetical protein AHiyo4_16550 [Arthrobacter sp. Hiyo4]|nr:hypothetical protein AHiyo4_16550 [Arthrobacter sp. Hiyo4]
MQLEFPASMTGAFLLGLLLAFVGTVLLGIAVWRSQVLPRWAGPSGRPALWCSTSWALSWGQATTGSSLPSQAAGAY